MQLLFISGSEVMVVFAFALIFFGAKSIPDIAKTLGKGMREFRKASNAIQREFEDSTSDMKDGFEKVTKTLGEDARKIMDDVKKFNTKDN